MKRNILFLLILLAFTNVSGQSHFPGLSPFTKKFLIDKNRKEASDFIGNYVHRNVNGKIFMSGMVKVNSTVDENSFSVLDVHIGTRAGTIWTVMIPFENVEAFSKVPGLDYIQLDEPSFPLLDNARLYTHVDSVHNGINLPMPYTGKGVVVGVVDAGYDFQHPVYFDTNGVNYRVKKVWLQKDATGPAPAGFAYGTEMTDSNALWTKGHDNDGTHATHVSGIFGGSGFGGLTDNRRFRGFAYESDMVLVGITPDKSQWINTGVSDMIDGINYIFSYANSVSKPAVVNLSWGSPLGPRDGTGLFSQAIDNLVGTGNIFVCSGGNNGEDSIHVQKTFTPTDSLVSTNLVIANTPIGYKSWVDMWGDSSKTFCVEISLRNNGLIASTGFVCIDDSTHEFNLVNSSNDTCWVSLMTWASEFNHKPRVFVDFDQRTNDSIIITVKGTDGTVNFWNTFVHETSGYYGVFRSYNDPHAVAGDINISISDIASSNEAISVGAYASKINWVSVGGGSYTYASYVAQGNLVPFSSHGPTVDGRIKPDITGPGLTVGSGISSFDSTFFSTGPSYPYVTNLYHNNSNGKNYAYGMLSGTSMSSPAVAGIVALMLQANPNLTVQEVKDIIFRTAIIDSWTGALPPSGTNLWGHGKINAFAAVRESVLSPTGVKQISASALKCNLYPNPNSGTFILDFEGNKNEKLAVSIYDMLGNVVFEKRWDVNPGYNYITIENELAQGTYIAKVSSVSGNSIIKVMVE